MQNTGRNLEKDHAHGDTASGTEINEEGVEKDDAEVTKVSPPECYPNITRIQHHSYGTDDKQDNSLLSISHLQANSARLLETDTPTATATIFDLCPEDRKRVGELISALASTSQNLTQLEENFELVCIRESEYQEKSQKLMKKVDVLNEKCHKLEGEKQQMKEKHVESLKTLNKTVTHISNQFEHSAKELKHLTDQNVILENENKLLREKVSSVQSQLAFSEKANQKLSESLVRQKSRLHELKTAEKAEKKQRSKLRNHKPTDKKEKSKSEDNYPENTQTPYDTQFGAKPCEFEEEILHDLFFMF